MLMALFNGITYAGLLFIIAVGFSLIFGIMQVVNMGHGAMYLIGAYIGLAAQRAVGGNWWVAVLVAALSVGLLSILLEKLVSFTDGDMPQTLLTLGLTLCLSDLCLWIWGGLPSTLTPPKSLSVPINMFGVTFPGYRLFTLVLAIIIGLFTWLLMAKTQLGRYLRAGVDDREMLRANGVNVGLVFTATWVIAGALVGLAGVVGGSYISFGPGTEFSILTLALVVVIIGGMGSVPGSAIGAIIVGLVDSFGRVYAGGLSSFLLMGTLVIVLAVRPQGIMGRSN